MQAIETRKIRRSEPSQKVVLAAAAGLLALLCLLVLIGSMLSGSTHPASSSVKTVAAQPAVGGAAGSTDSQPDHGYIP
jgi:hypothetical protein